MKKTTNRGQAVLEMAIVLPIFIFVFIGIFDFGRALHIWSNLNYQCMQAARAGTKRIHPLIARNVFGTTTHSSITEVQKAFWNFQSPLMPTDKYTNINFGGVGTTNQNVEVRASFNLTLYTPVMGSLVGDSSTGGALTITAVARERKE